MTVKSIRHKKVSGVADGSDPSLVRPQTDWNDDHNFFYGYRTVTGTTDTLADTDILSLITYNNATGVAVTLPVPSGILFALGWRVQLRNVGAGAVTITPSTCTINGSAAAIVLATGETIEIQGTGTADYVGIPHRTSVAYSVAQSLSTAQQALALSNIGAAQYNLINGKIVESHAANAATFAIKTLGGADPSATDPVTIRFNDGTLLLITAALSVVIPSGATLLTVNARPFRLWFTILNNSGSPVLAVRHCLNGAGSSYTVNGFNPRLETAVTPVGNVAQVTYAGTAVSNKPHEIIGYADYDSGLATAGTWNASPTRIILTNNRSPLPGHQISEAWAIASATVTTTGTTFINSISFTFPLISLINPCRIQVSGDCAATSGVGGEGCTCEIRLRNTATATLLDFAPVYCAYESELVVGNPAFDFLDLPAVSSTVYSLQFRNSASGTGTVALPNSFATMRVAEVMT